MSISQFINRFSVTHTKLNPKISSSYWYLLKPHKTKPLPIGCRSIHGDYSDKTQVQNQNPPPKTPNITQESEKICILLVNQSSKYDTDSALKSVEVDVSAALVLEVLNRLSNSGVLALSFFRWAEKQNGFKHTAETYNALIEALGKIKQFKMIWNLVGDMKQKGVLGKDTFSLISRRYARARMVKEAVEAFERMEKFGFKPELCDYNRLLDLLSKSRQVEKAQELFDKMKNRKFKPDTKSYTILLEGWGQAQHMLKLDEVFREMKGDGFQPDAVTYGIIIHAYCKAKRNDEAIEKLREMEANNIKPTPHVFSILINGLGNEKRLDEALKFFQLSKDFWFPPDAPTYNAVVGAFCRSMRVNDAYQVVEEMKEHGVGPNARTYDIILHHLVKAGRPEDAYTTFNIMRNMPGCEPVASTYEIIVRMFCNTNQTDRAVMVWETMKAKGVVPAMHMFSTLISNLCHENKLNEACTYLQEMCHMGIRPPAQTFGILKEALLEAGKQHTVVFLSQKLEDIRKTLSWFDG